MNIPPLVMKHGGRIAALLARCDDIDLTDEQFTEELFSWPYKDRCPALAALQRFDKAITKNQDLRDDLAKSLVAAMGSKEIEVLLTRLQFMVTAGKSHMHGDDFPKLEGQPDAEDETSLREHKAEIHAQAKRIAEGRAVIPKELPPEGESSALAVSYYLCPVNNPHQAQAPYVAECSDIQEALGMTHAEGEIFAGLWRKCSERSLGRKKAGNTAVRDAEKIYHYSKRVLSVETGTKVL